MKKIPDFPISKLANFGKSIGYKGILIGFLISVMASPMMNAAIADTAHQLRLPGYDKADLDFSMEKVTVKSYDQGQHVEYYDGLVWKNEYRIYDFTVENQGLRTLKNVKIDVPLPGCVVHTKSAGEGVRGIYEIRNPVSVSIRGSNESVIEKYPCTKRIVTEQFSPSEKIRVQFVATQNFDKCDLLIGYGEKASDQNTVIQYYFEKRGHLMKDRLVAGTPEDDDNYKNQLKNIDTGTYAVHNGDLGQYPIVLVGPENDTLSGAAAECG